MFSDTPPKKYEKRCVYFDARNAEQLDRLSKAENLNKSKVLNKCLEFYLLHSGINTETVELPTKEKK